MFLAIVYKKFTENLADEKSDFARQLEKSKMFYTGISRSYVSRIEKRALEKLKEALE